MVIASALLVHVTVAPESTIQFIGMVCILGVGIEYCIIRCSCYFFLALVVADLKLEAVSLSPTSELEEEYESYRRLRTSIV